MRVGIITLEAGHNYGGILQCYAFFQLLRTYGHSPQFLRVRPSEISRIKQLWAAFATNGVKGIIRKLQRKIVVQSEQEIADLEVIFDGFRARHFDMSPILDAETVGDYANAHYDAIIIGSDQVWTWLYNPNNATFIGWEPEFKGIRLSFSSCSVHSDLNDRERKKEIAGYLSQFKNITVRDTTTQTLVKNITHREVKIVPDPSELYDYSEFLSVGNTVSEPYILMYVIGTEIEGGHLEAIKRLRGRYGQIPVYGIRTGNLLSRVQEVADRMLDDVTPERWVELMAHATAIYTDSFHAVLFSQKFQRPVVAYYKDQVRASRMLYLKERFCVTSIVSKVSDIDEAQVLPAQPIDLCSFENEVVAYLKPDTNIKSLIPK